MHTPKQHDEPCPWRRRLATRGAARRTTGVDRGAGESEPISPVPGGRELVEGANGEAAGVLASMLLQKVAYGPKGTPWVWAEGKICPRLGI
jgi:hypothetical protein